MSSDNTNARRARQADYIFWLKKEYWLPPEASILLAGYEPELTPDGDIAYSELAGDADGIHRLIIESIDSKEIEVKNSPTDWLRWAEQKRLILPVELSAISPALDAQGVSNPVTKEAGAGGIATEMGLSRREQQIRAIESLSDSQEFSRMSIPDGGKSVIRKRCSENYSALFGAGTDPFKEAWQDAVSQGRIKMENHDKYAKR